MSLLIKYTSCPSPKDQLKIVDILERAFSDNIYALNTRNAFFKGFKSSYPNFVLLYKDEVVIGLAILAVRNISVLNNIIKSITVGPIAIDPIFQKKGYSVDLMNGVDEIAKNLDAELIYLQGIKNYYDKFGYYPCLAKSKLIINIQDIETLNEVSVMPFEDCYLEDIKQIYKQASNQNTCTSSRTDEDWLWLTKYAKESYYFFSPQIMRYKGHVIGYFCTDPTAPGRIREAIYTIDHKLIPIYLSGIRQYALEKELESVEIMTPRESSLYQYMKKEGTSTFVEFIRKRGGQLMKIVEIDALLKKISGYFDSSYCKVDLQLSSEFISFNFNEFKTSKNSQSVLCAQNHFPGLISNYYNENVLDGFDYLSDGMKTEYFSVFSKRIPFVYQGDNY